MYPIISIAQRDYSFQNLLVGDILVLSKIDKRYYQQQLSSILSTIVGAEVNPMLLTCEERYAALLVYLDITRDHNDLNQSLDINQYLSKDLDNFNKDRIFDENGVSVRHLLGIEAHALEIGCEGTEDWILGAMAITIGCEQLPPIDAATSLDFAGKMIKNRMDELRKLEVMEFNSLMAAYSELQINQDHLVNMAFDGGIVLEKIDLRGADDAPVRFQPSTAFKGYSKEILSIATRANTKL
ncbi:MAG: hypothetical protein H9855_02645 [Candidatus Acinetobacter avistercoris]|nr:hypothetical protein [Candidatus Acinetobacter avistercoris]